MCEVPPRRWREALPLQRVLLGVVGIGVMAWGYVKADSNNSIGMLLLGVGGVLVFAAAMGTINQAEFSIPFNLKLATTVRDRADTLSKSFEALRPELEWCAIRLCDDEEAVAKLLTVTIARAANAWRGPPGPDLRVYAYCWLVHRLLADYRLGALHPSAITSIANTALAELTLNQRIAAVLHEGADLSPDQIAEILHASPNEVQDDLARARALLTQASGRGGQQS